MYLKWSKNIQALPLLTQNSNVPHTKYEQNSNVLHTKYEQNSNVLHTKYEQNLATLCTKHEYFSIRFNFDF